MNKEYFTGYITQRLRKKVYDKQSQYFKQVYYKLLIDQEVPVFCYANVVNSDIFQTISQRNFLKKKYLFTVQRSKWGWVLLNWEEIKSFI